MRLADTSPTSAASACADTRDEWDPHHIPVPARPASSTLAVTLTFAVIRAEATEQVGCDPVGERLGGGRWIDFGGERVLENTRPTRP